MQKPLLYIAYLLASALPSQCIAQEVKLGVLARIGSASQSVGQANFNERDLSYTIGGIYRLNANFAGELRFDQFGTVNFGTAPGHGKLSASAFSAGAIAMLPITPQANLYAKAGVAHWRNKFEDTLGAMTSSGDNFYYGFGAGYRIQPATDITLEYSAIELDAYATYQIVDYRIGNLALGINFYF